MLDEPRTSNIQALLETQESQTILLKIMKYGSLSTCIDKNFYQVCKSWRSLLEQRLNLEECFSEPSNTNGYPSIKTLNSLLVTSVYFYKINNTRLPAPLVFAHLIKKIGFLSTISEENLEKLLTPCANITSLLLDQWTIGNLDKYDFGPLMQLKKLESLILSGDFMKLKHASRIIDWNHSTNQLMRILDNTKFPNLIQLVVKSIWLPDNSHEFFILQSFWEAMIRHSSSLRYLTFSTRNYYKEVENKKKKRYHKIRVNVNKLKQLKLASISFGGQFSTQLPTTKHVFFQLFGLQKNLEHAFCDFTQFGAGIKALDNLSTNLVCLELILDPDLGQIDCEKYFGGCNRLEILSLVASAKTEEQNTNLEPQLLNLSKLDHPHLKVIRIRRLNLGTNEASHLVTTRPLGLLELVEIGENENLGIQFDQFALCIQQKRVQSFILGRCFNAESMQKQKFKEENAEFNYDDGAGAGDHESICSATDQICCSKDEENLLSPHFWIDYEDSNDYLAALLNSHSEYSILKANNVKAGNYFKNEPYLEHSLQFAYPLAYKEPKVDAALIESDGDIIEIGGGGSSCSDDEMDEDYATPSESEAGLSDEGGISEGNNEEDNGGDETDNETSIADASDYEIDDDYESVVNLALSSLMEAQSVGDVANYSSEPEYIEIDEDDD